MKNINPFGLFDEYYMLENLSKLGDPLEKLNKHIVWTMFKPALEDAFDSKSKDPSKGGRPPFDRLMLFKALIIQALYNISDDQLEYQITDRASFKRFLGIKISDKVPDSKTFWAFREHLINCGTTDKLFGIFNGMLESANVLANIGSIVDASFVEVPRQRNDRDENKQIKETGKAPEEWKDNTHKLAQKDIDARWTKKRDTTYYGYKNHIKIDSVTKLITNFVVTNASVHDSQVLSKLLTEKDRDKPLYADSAYKGALQEKLCEEMGIIARINEKGYRNKPLTEKQKADNRKKSKIRARVEHIFGFFWNSMNGLFLRSIGIIRSAALIGIKNLTYNIFRFVQLEMMKKEVIVG